MIYYIALALLALAGWICFFIERAERIDTLRALGAEVKLSNSRFDKWNNASNLNEKLVKELDEHKAVIKTLRDRGDKYKTVLTQIYNHEEKNLIHFAQAVKGIVGEARNW